MLCHYAQCHYAECGALFTVMLNVFVLSFVMLNVDMLSVVMLNVVMLSLILPFHFSTKCGLYYKTTTIIIMTI